MKNLLSLFVMGLFGLSLNANPIMLPTIEISELYFESPGVWKLEFYYYRDEEVYVAVDSVFLISPRNEVKLQNLNFEGNNMLFVITQDSLDVDFPIYAVGDTITVRWYSWNEFSEDEFFETSLIFGNVSGAYISQPRIGQSIARLSWAFCKDKSPTISTANDTIGVCGTMSGTIYDISLNPVKNRLFRSDFNFETDDNGNYTARVYSRPNTFWIIHYAPGDYVTNYVNISQISYVVEPDSIIYRDIYLQGVLLTDVNAEIVNDPIKLYPNPVGINGKLNYEIDLPVKSAKVVIKCMTMEGKMIKEEVVRNAKGEIDLSNHSGFMLVSVWVDGKLMKTKKIVVTNE